MSERKDPGPRRYLVPSQDLTGTREETLAEVDEMLRRIAAFRLTLEREGEADTSEHHRGRSLPDGPARLPRAFSLSVHVVATTVEGTRCALVSANRLTGSLSGPIVLLVPRVTSFAARYDPTSDERRTMVERNRALAASMGADATVVFCVCHRLEDVVHQMLGRSSLVIVGGRKGSWWPSREERLARRLTAEGYPVVFAQVAADLERARVLAAS
jgi:hypothetical protein